jgi:hypothetical protein
MSCDYEAVRRLGLALPDVEEGTSYGTPALKVKGALMTRLWEDGQTLVRLPKVHPDAMRDLLQTAHRLALAPKKRPRARGRRRSQ